MGFFKRENKNDPLGLKKDYPPFRTEVSNLKISKTNIGYYVLEIKFSNPPNSTTLRYINELVSAYKWQWQLGELQDKKGIYYLNVMNGTSSQSIDKTIEMIIEFLENKCKGSISVNH